MNISTPPPFASFARLERPGSVFRKWTGRLTEQLRLESALNGLGKVPARLNPEATTRSICGFCSTGCSLDIHLKNGIGANLSPTLDYPVNLGMACPKGWEALTPLAAPDRATVPLVRQPDGSMKPVRWEQAMDLFVSKFKTTMAEHGPGSVAFLSTGQICTEEMAFLGALFKFGMGGVHCDSNTRQCMATAHAAYKESFGFDAPPFTYADFEASDVLVFLGANPCIAHPIMWQRVLRNQNNPNIIVVDPRRTETAMNATRHIALRPKSDLVLLYGVANLLVQRGWIDRSFLDRNTTGFEAFAQFVRSFTLDKVAAETGVAVDELIRFAETIHYGEAVSFWWTMGVNQSHQATRTAQAIINLALITGNIGRPGTGPNSITGQCNAMGSRLFSNTSGLLGGRDFQNARHRAEVASVLNLSVERIPTTSSLAYDQILERIAGGEIKALWVIGTNSAHSWVNQREVRAVLNRLDFLAVQDLYTTTDTARHAHLILPAAGWGEKEGTMINSERRFGVVKRVSHAPGQALTDFNIFRLVAQAWGCGELFAQWSSPQAVFQILKRLSAGRPCDFTGIEGYEMLELAGGIQWPFPQLAEQPSCGPQERRLFGDGRFFTPDGRARLVFDPPRVVAEPVDDEFPFVLLTGRGTSAQWHTNTRTGKSAVLRSLYPQQAYVEVNWTDARRLGIEPHQPVRVVSRRAEVQCTAVVTGTVQPGQLFMPMHYEITNQLTLPEFDPHSRQPSFKHCAVRLEPAAGADDEQKEAKAAKRQPNAAGGGTPPLYGTAPSRRLGKDVLPDWWK